MACRVPDDASLEVVRLSKTENALMRSRATQAARSRDRAQWQHRRFQRAPVRAPAALTSVREYDARDGHLVRVFSPGGFAEFHQPRGLRFVAFDFASGACLGTMERLPRLYGQELVSFP
jgi:hypothetical protein